MNNKEYHSKLVTIISNMKEVNRIEFNSKFNEKAFNPVAVFGLSLFFWLFWSG